MELDINTKKLTKRDRIMLSIVLAPSAIAIVMVTIAMLTGKEVSVGPAYIHEYNGLTIEINDPYITTDEDTAKVIINVPVALTNESDHGFKVYNDDLSYNGDKDVSMLFDVLSGTVNGKISRGEEVTGTITVYLDTRDTELVKTVQPTFSVYDMKTEEEIELNPDLAVEVN